MRGVPYHDEIHRKIMSLCLSFYKQPWIKMLVLDLDDLVGAAYLGIMLAEKLYDPRKGAFWPYAKLFCRNEIIKEVRRSADIMPRQWNHGAYPLPSRLFIQ